MGIVSMCFMLAVGATVTLAGFRLSRVTSWRALAQVALATRSPQACRDYLLFCIQERAAVSRRPSGATSG